MRIADEHLRNAGRDVADADDQKQQMHRQRGIQDAREHHADDRLKRLHHGEIGIRLLQLLLFHDVRQQRAGRRRKDAADRVA